MSITQFGRVEFDPMRIPVPTRSATRDIPSFEQQFQAKVTPGERFKAVPANEVDEKTRETAISQPVPNGNQLEAPPSKQRARRSERIGTVIARSAARSLPSEAREPELETINHGGASARRKGAGKGAGAPAISLADDLAQSQVKAQHNPSNHSEVISQFAITNSLPQSASNAGPTTISSDGLAVKESAAKATDRVNSPLAGYKTVNKYSLRFVEAARESVFKQIALRLKADGGEMILRLDPPELGKLDLKMQITNHNQMRLVINTERPELAALLEKHMAELEQELQRQGITITDTEIRHSNQHGASAAEDSFRHQFDADLEDTGDEEGTAVEQLNKIRPGVGFITADSLDFWA